MLPAGAAVRERPAPSAGTIGLDTLALLATIDRDVYNTAAFYEGCEPARTWRLQKLERARQAALQLLESYRPQLFAWRPRKRRGAVPANGAARSLSA